MERTAPHRASGEPLADPWRRALARLPSAWVAHVFFVLFLCWIVYVLEGPFFDQLDETVLRALWPMHSESGFAWAEAISLIGQPWLAVPFWLCALGLVYAYAGARQAAFLFLVYFFAGAEFLLLVELFGRERPWLFAELPKPHGFSTPSGHCTATMSLFASLAVIAVRKLGWRGVWIAVPCVSIVVVVGLTRPYLQAHFPSDVILAWLMTGSWMVIVDAVLFKNAFSKWIVR